MSSAGVVAQERAAPCSCSTNLSNVVIERLRQAKLGSRAMEVCLYLHRQTFDNAGRHRKQGREEWWCSFDLARWSRVLACEKSNLLRIRQALVDCQIISFDPDELHPGEGRIGWNLEVEDWQPYDQRRTRICQSGQLAPRQQESVGIAEWQEGTVDSQSQRATALVSSRVGGAKQLHPKALAQPALPLPATPEMLASEASASPSSKEPSDQAPTLPVEGTQKHQVSGPPELVGVHRSSGRVESVEQAPTPAQAGPLTPPPGGMNLVISLPPAPDPSDWQAERDARTAELARLRATYEQRVAALNSPLPRGCGELQALSELRVEVHRLKQQIEVEEATLLLQQQRMEGIETEHPPALSGGAVREGEDPEVLCETEDAECKASPASSGPAMGRHVHLTPPQLAFWREEVQAEQRELRRLQREYEELTEQLKHPLASGLSNWSEARKRQRNLAWLLQDQQKRIERYQRFVALVEQEATKEEAAELAFQQEAQEAWGGDAEQAPDEEVAEAEEAPPPPKPKLTGEPLRRALFAALTRLFTNGDPRFVTLERGRFNAAIQKFRVLDLQPDDLPILKEVFERVWPKATCTALGLANNLPLLIEKARDMGWSLGEETSPSAVVQG
jgi:hypothetical protein